MRPVLKITAAPYLTLKARCVCSIIAFGLITCFRKNANAVASECFTPDKADLARVRPICTASRPSGTGQFIVLQGSHMRLGGDADIILLIRLPPDIRGNTVLADSRGVRRIAGVKNGQTAERRNEPVMAVRTAAVVVMRPGRVLSQLLSPLSWVPMVPRIH
jgi:hypothetical protein